LSIPLGDNGSVYRGIIPSAWDQKSSLDKMADHDTIYTGLAAVKVAVYVERRVFMDTRFEENWGILWGVEADAADLIYWNCIECDDGLGEQVDQVFLAIVNGGYDA
jgi:hypothetical protein